MERLWRVASRAPPELLYEAAPNCLDVLPLLSVSTFTATCRWFGAKWAYRITIWMSRQPPSLLLDRNSIHLGYTLEFRRHWLPSCRNRRQSGRNRRRTQKLRSPLAGGTEPCVNLTLAEVVYRIADTYYPRNAIYLRPPESLPRSPPSCRSHRQSGRNR